MPTSKADITRELRRLMRDASRYGRYYMEHHLSENETFLKVAQYFYSHFEFSSLHRKVILRDVKRRSYRTDRCEICGEPAYWFIYGGVLFAFRCYHGDRKRHPSKGGGHVYKERWRCIWRYLEDDRVRDMLLSFGIDQAELEDGAD